MSSFMDMQAVPSRPIWQRRWFQVLAGMLLALLVASFIIPPLFQLVYELRGVLLPVVLAFALAYVFNPVITFLQHRARVPRWAGASAVLATALLALVLFCVLAVPPMVAQSAELVVKARAVYPRAVARIVETARSLHLLSDEADTSDAPLPADPATPPGESPSQADPPLTTDPTPDLETTDPATTATPATDTTEPVPLPDPDELRSDPALALQSLLDEGVRWLQNLEWGPVFAGVARSLDIGVGVVSGAVSFTTYLLLATVIIAFCFFYFAWKFDEITGWFVSFIPASQRDSTLGVLRQMDRSIAAFVRGRLVQATVMACILSTGWLVAGVPYWLLLGILAGFANLVPFLAAVGWIVATVLSVIDQTAGTDGFTWWAVLAPTAVYFVAQGIDGWVVEPLVQGKATNLDPISVLLAVMIGGSLAGLLGMLIAIPTAACIKILAKELLLPRLRQLAAAN